MQIGLPPNMNSLVSYHMSNIENSMPNQDIGGPELNGLLMDQMTRRDSLDSDDFNADDLLKSVLDESEGDIEDDFDLTPIEDTPDISFRNQGVSQPSMMTEFNYNVPNQQFPVQQQQMSLPQVVSGQGFSAFGNQAVFEVVDEEPMFQQMHNPAFEQNQMMNNVMHGQQQFNMSLQPRGMNMDMNGLNSNTMGMQQMHIRHSSPVPPIRSPMQHSPMQLSPHGHSPHPHSPHGHSPPPQNGGADLKAYSDAMEKLCETMKRSAMSRNLVKQMSGRSLTKQGSQRSLTKQGSHRNLLSKQLSGRDLNALARQASGRDLMQRQLSARNLPRQSSLRGLGDDCSGLLTPTLVPNRRLIMDTKHRITRDALTGGGAPGRGIFRHNSSSALLGHRKGASIQFDDASPFVSAEMRFPAI